MSTALLERAGTAALTRERRRLVAFGLAAFAGIATLFSLIHRYAADYALAVDIMKGAIAAVSALCLLYEARRARQHQPIAERWKRRAAIGLSVAALTAYFNGLRIDYPFYHRWEHYHYYLGAKYFPEMEYDNLYKCTVIAQDEIGSVTYADERTGQRTTLDMSAEVRRPGRKIRNIGVDNLLMDVGGVLDHPESCKASFSPERWMALKADVQFFRTASEQGYWEDMERDHGYNPPPVWTIMGRALAELHPATTSYLRLLACVDIAYLLGVFAALYWAFGWRVCAVAACSGRRRPASPSRCAGGSRPRRRYAVLPANCAVLANEWHEARGDKHLHALERGRRLPEQDDLASSFHGQGQDHTPPTASCSTRHAGTSRAAAKQTMAS